MLIFIVIALFYWREINSQIHLCR